MVLKQIIQKVFLWWKFPLYFSFFLLWCQQILVIFIYYCKDWFKYNSGNIIPIVWIYFENCIIILLYFLNDFRRFFLLIFSSCFTHILRLRHRRFAVKSCLSVWTLRRILIVHFNLLYNLAYIQYFYYLIKGVLGFWGFGVVLE